MAQRTLDEIQALIKERDAVIVTLRAEAKERNVRMMAVRREIWALQIEGKALLGIKPRKVQRDF